MTVKFLLIWMLCVVLDNTDAYDFRYHNYSQITNFLHNIVAIYPTKAAVFDIGKTEGGEKDFDFDLP